MHQWLRRHFPLTGTCKECGSDASRTERAFRLHPAPYTRDPRDYRELCRRCHVAFDGYFGRARIEAERT